MAGDRTLKLSFLGDVSNLTTSLKKAETETETFGSKVGEVGKKMGVALAAAAAAAGAYAIKLAVDGVKAAMADEQAQLRLATSLRNVTGATDETIASVEKWISTTQIALGVSDEKLRPAFERLARATKDVEEAQKLTTLALDVAAGSGKSLDQVAQALGRAYEGNTSSLSKLGLGIDVAKLKTMSFEEVTALLSKTFEGQATKQADTFAGKVARLGEAWGEAKETVGGFIIEALTPLLTTITNTVIPALQTVSEKIGKNLKEPFEQVAKTIQEFVIPFLKSLWTYITEVVAPGLSKFFQPIVKALADAFNTVAKAFKDNKDELQPFFALIKEVADFIFTTLIPLIGVSVGRQVKIFAEGVSLVIRGIANVVEFVANSIQRQVNLGIGAINLLIKAWNAVPDWAKPGGDIKPLNPVDFKLGGGGAGSSNQLDADRYTAMIPKTAGGGTGGGTGTGSSFTAGGSSGGSTGGSSSSTSLITVPSMSAEAAKAVYVDAFNAANQGAIAAATVINSTLDDIMSRIEALATKPTVVVEAGIGDPEAIARTVETVLYNSTARMGRTDYVIA